MTAHAPARESSRRRVVRWILVVAAAVVVVAAVLFVRDALRARDSFTAIMEDLPAIQEALLDGDPERLDALVAELQQHTATARASTDGPVWWVAGNFPVLGDNAAVLTLMAEVMDDVALDVLPPLAEARSSLADGVLQISGSRIDLEPIRQAAAPLTAAYDAVVDADDRLQDFDPTDLVSQLAGPFDQAAASMAELRTVVTTGRDLTTLLPPMLGDEGRREYLVLAQSNAELRATGGVPGAILLISADDGLVTLERTATASDIGPFSEPVLDLRPDDLAMYGEGLGRFIQDVTMTPQFPVGAHIAAEMWQQSQGSPVDGVIAVDPVALSFLLDQIGPIEVDGATLDAGNVIDTLLSEVYLANPDPADADAVFARVASAVVDAVFDGQTDAGDLLDAVTRAADERRLLIWSAHAAEQALLSEGGAGGDFDAATTAVGIFLNDGTRSKMSYYLDTDVTLVSSECTAAGRVDTIELRLSSTLSSELAPTLPSYVTGVDLPPDRLGTIRTNVSLHSAVGGQIVNIARDGSVIGGDVSETDGRTITVFTQDLAPQESVTFRMDVIAASGDVAGVMELWMTPSARSAGLHQYETATC